MTARPLRSSAPLIVDRTLKDRDLAGHFSTEIREERWRAQRKTWWSWYGQRRHDLEAVFRSRYCREGATMPRGAEMEAVARAMAFHLQAIGGSEQLRAGLEDWFEQILPCGLRDEAEEPDIDQIVADVSRRRRDITALRAGQLLMVTWEERTRLRLRTIRPCGLTHDQFKAAAADRKRELDRERADRTRRRQRKAVRAVYRWQADCEPWLYLGVSRKTWYRHKKAGTLGKLVSGCPITVPEWLVECCRQLDLAPRVERDTSSSRIDVVSESADALVSLPETSPAESAGVETFAATTIASTSPSRPFLNAGLSHSGAAEESGSATSYIALHTRCPVRVANDLGRGEQAA